MNAVESLNSKMFDVIKKCVGKQVILYGYGKSGIFIEWLCSHVYGKKFTLVIDDKKVIPGINLHRKIILDYIDPKETVILISFRRERMTENDMSQMTAYGYEEGKNLFYLKDMIIPDTLGLYSFLEHECGTDFLKRVDQSEFDYEAMDGNVRAAEFMRDTAGQKQENIQAQKEFEYKKERDAGISQEIEDLDDIEEEIYGKANESQESKEEGSEAEEDDNV